MAEEGDYHESRFVCKLCNKNFPCGKSLGGHMRSHVVAANSAEFEERFEKKISSFDDFVVQSNTHHDSKSAEFGNGQQSSYVLRENPKKTWRAVDSRVPLPQDKICKQCGKGFQSLKALCGHMACHSERDTKILKDDYSWSSENQKAVFDSYSDTEEGEERRMRTRSSSAKNKRYKKFVEKSHFALANNNMNGSSSVSEIDGQEQEEVAMCLMLLSRDYNGVNSVVESSDNTSVVLETKSSSIEMRIGKRDSVNYIFNQDEVKKNGDMKLKGKMLDDEIDKMGADSDSGYFLDECAKAESDVSVDWFRKYNAFRDCKNEDYRVKYRKSFKVIKNELRKLSKDNENDGDDGVASYFESRKRKYSSENRDGDNSEKKSKYECFNCKKTFKSYQALGGHRPCHKRTNAYYESRYESGENSLDDSTDYRAGGKIVESSKKSSSSKKMKANKNKPHVCPFCSRVFKNGQALGGHKRSHFVGGHEENNNQRREVKTDGHDLLDLNLPAPEADGDNESGQFDLS